MTWRAGSVDRDGIRKDYRHDGQGGVIVRVSSDVAPVLDRNKAMANHNDGYSQSRELRRVASIPAIVRMKWLLEEGWDCLDPACASKLVQKLNSSDYAHLRTAEGNLAVSNGVMR